MQLFYAATSPFARKVRIAAHELGLHDRLTLIATDPWQSQESFTVLNPLSQIPALTLDDGTVLYDSSVICDYLDHLSGNRLIPREGPARWTVKRREALANGLAEAAVKRRIETTQRSEPQRSDSYIARQRAALMRGLDALENEASDLQTDAVTIAHCAIAAMLSYLDFRFGEDRWQDGRPQLAGWFAAFCDRPSMRATSMPTQ